MFKKTAQLVRDGFPYHLSLTDPVGKRRYRAARAGIARQKLKENITKVNTVDGEGDRKQIETWIPLASV